MRTKTLLVLLLACGAAQAADWASLGKSDDGAQEVFVDGSRIRVKAGIRQAWIETLFAPRTRRGVDENASKWQQRSIALYSYNCNDETVKIESLATYFDDGTIYTTPADSNSGPWRPVPPDTLLNAQMQFICAWKPK